VSSFPFSTIQPFPARLRRLATHPRARLIRDCDSGSTNRHVQPCDAAMTAIQECVHFLFQTRSNSFSRSNFNPIEPWLVAARSQASVSYAVWINPRQTRPDAKARRQSMAKNPRCVGKGSQKGSSLKGVTPFSSKNWSSTQVMRGWLPTAVLQCSSIWRKVSPAAGPVAL